MTLDNYEEADRLKTQAKLVTNDLRTKLLEMQKYKATLVKIIIFMKSQLDEQTEKEKVDEEPKLNIKETYKDSQSLKEKIANPTIKQFIDYCMSMQFRQAQKDLDF